MAVGTSHNTWIWLPRVEKILLRLWNYCACHAKAGVTFAPERGSHSPLNPLHRTSFRGKCDPTWFRGKCDPRAIINHRFAHNIWTIFTIDYLTTINPLSPWFNHRFTIIYIYQPVDITIQQQRRLRGHAAPWQAARPAMSSVYGVCVGQYTWVNYNINNSSWTHELVPMNGYVCLSNLGEGHNISLTWIQAIKRDDFPQSNYDFQWGRTVRSL